MSNKNILIVDDDSFILELFEHYKDKNSNLDVSSSIEDGLKKIKENKYDRVIADFRFKKEEKNGYDVLAEAEKNGVKDRILLTSVSEIQSLKGTNASYGIRKPLTKKSIKELCSKEIKDFTFNGKIKD